MDVIKLYKCSLLGNRAVLVDNAFYFESFLKIYLLLHQLLLNDYDGQRQL